MSDSDQTEESELKRKRPKQEISVKKETRDRDFKCETIMKSIIESEDWTDFAKDYCQRKLSNNSKYFGKFFATIKNDLNEMIKEERIFIYNHTNLSSANYDRREGKDTDKSLVLKQILLFSISNSSKGNTNKKTNYSKFFEPDYTESKQQPWFRTINKAIINDCSVLNKIERAEIKRLMDKVEIMCQTKFDKISEDYLIESDIISKTSCKDVIQMQKEKKNEQVIEQLDRRIEYNSNNDIESFQNDIESELDQMIHKKDMCLPIFFNISYGSDNSSQTVTQNRKINGKKIYKFITVNFMDIDRFELYRMNQLAFEWIKKIYGIFTQKQQETIDNKIEQVLEAIDNE